MVFESFSLNFESFCFGSEKEKLKHVFNVQGVAKGV